ncbi:hypothetical protein ACG0Z6_08430 [Roseateles sp. BYS180W]|uniref:Tetratricopeptide repeat protein n=1 Tax=Roseateles rivi TaxID=3299028 RepID=A0ABW7FVJ1_9BURK
MTVLPKNLSGDMLARWERLTMRHPGLMLPLLRQGMEAPDPRLARLALLGTVFVLERWGRAAELQTQLQQSRTEALARNDHAEAAELAEAQGRLHYQNGDYEQACEHWLESLQWADPASRCACQARIGLAHSCYALGEWARGGQQLDLAEQAYPRLAQDLYLSAKVALNRAVACLSTEGPVAALLVLEQAEPVLRKLGHRDYSAELQWQRARCLRELGDLVQAQRINARALHLARQCHYRWLEVQCHLLDAQLLAPDAATAAAQAALVLAQQLQSRSLQAAVHERLSHWANVQGQLGPAYHHHEQQRQLEASLGHSWLRQRLQALVRFSPPRPQPMDAGAGPAEQAVRDTDPAQLAQALGDGLAQLLAQQRQGQAPSELALQRLLAHSQQLQRWVESRQGATPVF